MFILHQGWSGGERPHYKETGCWLHMTTGFGLEKSPPPGSGDFYLEYDGATPDEIWLVNDLLQCWQGKTYLPQATLIEDNDISLQFLPWKARVALMFYSLYIASSVWAARVMEGKCVEIACFQTLMPMDAFFAMRKGSEETSYLDNHVHSQISPFFCLGSILPTIYFLQCFKEKQ